MTKFQRIGFIYVGFYLGCALILRYFLRDRTEYQVEMIYLCYIVVFLIGAFVVEYLYRRFVDK